MICDEMKSFFSLVVKQTNLKTYYIHLEMYSYDKTRVVRPTKFKGKSAKKLTHLCVKGFIANNEPFSVVVGEGVYEFVHQHSATLPCIRSLLDDILI